jgi:hypothetical protein
MKTSGYDRERDGSLAGWFARWTLVGFIAAIAFGALLMHLANERVEAARPSHQLTDR